MGGGGRRGCAPRMEMEFSDLLALLCWPFCRIPKQTDPSQAPPAPAPAYPFLFAECLQLHGWLGSKRSSATGHKERVRLEDPSDPCSGPAPSASYPGQSLCLGVERREDADYHSSGLFQALGPDANSK